ncbi:hypothetical protein CEP54_012692 [Fusarium duplospermum]|uniref:AMP-dependent synthetase/ligase domain-containing protein n=1 Tax=Fusarium duplospermum TaxID=1325734 RepID=A0A428P782_9HYPO|nr:hypothetical protein CEP54_012692 [Fusarium duplospermum]
MPIPSHWPTNIPNVSLPTWRFGDPFSPLPDYTAYVNVNQPDTHTLSFEDYRRWSKRIALGLENSGLRPGDRVLFFGGNALVYLEVAYTCLTIQPSTGPQETPWERVTGVNFSGTSGIQKGVETTHSNYVATGEAAMVRRNLERKMHQPHRALCFLPLYHAAAQTVYAIDYPKMGVTTYMMPGFNFPQMLECIARFAITELLVAPPIVQALPSPLARKYDLRLQVAPAELEAVLLECPGVADVGVVGVQLADGEAHRAYVVKTHNSTATGQEITIIHRERYFAAF